MRLGFDAVRLRMEAGDDMTTIAAVLEESGKTFLGATGGAIGVILARMLMRGGAALRDVTELGGPEFQAMLTAIEASVDVTGPARSVAGPTLSLEEALARAAGAAEEGAQRTAGILCRAWRAYPGALRSRRRFVCRDPARLLCLNLALWQN